MLHSPTPGAVAIRVVGLSKTYAGTNRAAVEDLSLEIEAGSLFTLLGPSGCGKTTTMRCIAGLEEPNAGEIWVNDQLVFSSSQRVNIPSHKRQIGMVFQSYAIWPHLTVAQNVAYPLKNLGWKRQDVQRGVERALGIVGLTELASKPTPLLSGGQQQRVALARAFVGNPSVLLLDEPLSNLDAKLREQMQIELKDIQQQIGVTTLYVTHDQEEAFSMSTTMGVMDHGRLIELGSAREVYQVPATTVGAEFLGKSTRLDGKVRVAEGDGYRVETQVGALFCRSRHVLKAGDEVLVYVRPEDIRIVTEKRQAGPHEVFVDATVTRHLYHGGVYDWWASVDSIELRGRTLSNVAGADVLETGTGATVRLGILATRCIPVAIQEQPASA